MVRVLSLAAPLATSIPYSLGYNELAWIRRSELAFEEGLKRLLDAPPCIRIFSCVSLILEVGRIILQ